MREREREEKGSRGSEKQRSKREIAEEEQALLSVLQAPLQPEDS